MKHLIAGHNFAHRDLGQLTREQDLEYELGRAIDQVSEWIGRPCDDFAWGFGHSRHLSPQAAAYLSARCKRVYSGVRGLNVVGVTPRFMLRDCVAYEHPFSFIKAALEGALDGHWKRREWAALEQSGGVLGAAARAASSP